MVSGNGDILTVTGCGKTQLSHTMSVIAQVMNQPLRAPCVRTNSILAAQGDMNYYFYQHV